MTAEKKALILYLTLAEIAREGCDNFTSGDCWSSGRTAGHSPISKFGAYRVCNPCLAQAALDSMETEE